MNPEFFGNLELAQVLEKAAGVDDSRFVDSLKQIKKDPVLENFEFSTGVACFAGRSPYTGVQGFGLGENSNRNEELLQIEKFFKEKGVSTILHIPSVAESSLFKLLREKNYKVLDLRNCYIYDNFKTSSSRHGQVEIREVQSASDLEIWMNVVASGFAGQNVDEPDEITKGQSQKKGNRFYIAYIDSEPAGASALYVDGEVARLGGMGTLVKFRGKGIQNCMVSHRVEVSKELGCKYIFSDTQAGNNSQRNLERNGFKLAYVRLIYIGN